jgi:hypothetical protein
MQPSQSQLTPLDQWLSQRLDTFYSLPGRDPRRTALRKNVNEEFKLLEWDRDPGPDKNLYGGPFRLLNTHDNGSYLLHAFEVPDGFDFGNPSDLDRCSINVYPVNPWDEWDNDKNLRASIGEDSSINLVYESKGKERASSITMARGPVVPPLPASGSGTSSLFHTQGLRVEVRAASPSSSIRSAQSAQSAPFSPFESFPPGSRGSLVPSKRKAGGEWQDHMSEARSPAASSDVGSMRSSKRWFGTEDFTNQREEDTHQVLRDNLKLRASEDTYLQGVAGIRSVLATPNRHGDLVQLTTTGALTQDDLENIGSCVDDFTWSVVRNHANLSQQLQRYIQPYFLQAAQPDLRSRGSGAQLNTPSYMQPTATSLARAEAQALQYRQPLPPGPARGRGSLPGRRAQPSPGSAAARGGGIRNRGQSLQSLPLVGPHSLPPPPPPGAPQQQSWGGPPPEPVLRRPPDAPQYWPSPSDPIPVSPSEQGSYSQAQGQLSLQRRDRGGQRLSSAPSVASIPQSEDSYSLPLPPPLTQSTAAGGVGYPPPEPVLRRPPDAPQYWPSPSGPIPVPASERRLYSQAQGQFSVQQRGRGRQGVPPQSALPVVSRSHQEWGDPPSVPVPPLVSQYDSAPAAPSYLPPGPSVPVPPPVSQYDSAPAGPSYPPPAPEAPVPAAQEGHRFPPPTGTTNAPPFGLRSRGRGVQLNTPSYMQPTATSLAREQAQAQARPPQYRQPPPPGSAAAAMGRGYPPVQPHPPAAPLREGESYYPPRPHGVGGPGPASQHPQPLHPIRQPRGSYRSVGRTPNPRAELSGTPEPGLYDDGLPHVRPGETGFDWNSRRYYAGQEWTRPGTPGTNRAPDDGRPHVRPRETGFAWDSRWYYADQEWTRPGTPETNRAPDAERPHLRAGETGFDWDSRWYYRGQEWTRPGTPGTNRAVITR